MQRPAGGGDIRQTMMPATSARPSAIGRLMVRTSAIAATVAAHGGSTFHMNMFFGGEDGVRRGGDAAGGACRAGDRRNRRVNDHQMAEQVAPQVVVAGGRNWRPSSPRARAELSAAISVPSTTTRPQHCDWTARRPSLRHWVPTEQVTAASTAARMIACKERHSERRRRGDGWRNRKDRPCVSVLRSRIVPPLPQIRTQGHNAGNSRT